MGGNNAREGRGVNTFLTIPSGEQDPQQNENRRKFSDFLTIKQPGGFFLSGCIKTLKEACKYFLVLCSVYLLGSITIRRC